MRALTLYAAWQLDLAESHSDPAVRTQAQALGDLLIPIVKGWCTEFGVELASTGIQVHGGMGFIEETGAAQWLRDVRITAIYEGTTGIQANDLLGRKLARDQGGHESRSAPSIQLGLAREEAPSGAVLPQVASLRSGEREQRDAPRGEAEAARAARSRITVRPRVGVAVRAGLAEHASGYLLVRHAALEHGQAHERRLGGGRRRERRPEHVRGRVARLLLGEPEGRHDRVGAHSGRILDPPSQSVGAEALAGEAKVGRLDDSPRELIGRDLQ